MAHEKNPQTPAETAPPARRCTIRVAAGVLYHNQSCETADISYVNVESAGPALANNILDLYQGGPKATPDIEAADEISSVNVQAAHVLNNEYMATTPYSISLLQENGKWTISATDTSDEGPWSDYGSGDLGELGTDADMYGAESIANDEQQAAVLQQMHDILEMAPERARLGDVERPF
jgi:hypothetical protein